jgi:hypothetical protein
LTLDEGRGRLDLRICERAAAHGAPILERAVEAVDRGVRHHAEDPLLELMLEPVHY